LSSTKNISISFASTVAQKAADYKQLVKLNLSLLVVFGSMVGYWIAPNIKFNLLDSALLFIGGFLVTSSANACNELIEQQTDKLMKRTATRPLPSGRMEQSEAMIFATLSLLLGLAILGFKYNLLTAFISLLSFVIYVLAYTPLKRISNVNVFVGAIPGALPTLIGWSAATGNVSVEGWVLFTIQFLWQFPHFWSIAWLAHEDYTAAGLKMLPTGSKDNKFTSMQCVQYTIAILSFSFLPKYFGLTGWLAVVILAIAGIYFLYRAIQFYKFNNNDSARQLMFASFIYLPLTYIAFLIDKI
jgi:heme o synthase